MKVFDFENYRDFLRLTLQNLPKRGHGQAAKIAQALDIHPSLVTLVLQGKKDFTLEQASDLAEFWGFSELEADYFVALVGVARAGRESLRRRLRRQLGKLRAQAATLKDLIPPATELSAEAKSIFYSQWYYSAIRMLSSLERYHSADAIADRLGLPRAKVNVALEFLLRHGLCVEEAGKLRMGAQSTHVGNDSPLVTRHHVNWRERGIACVENMRDDELFFTSPVSIARKDVPRVRKVLVQAIEDAFKIIDPSACEEVACLNIDWFRF
jgi:uncharacterized protein (TIGR02147 family)